MTRRSSPRSTAEIAPARWIDQPDQLIELVEELRTEPAFGVDTEFHRERTYFAQLALVQVSWGQQRALIDPLALDLTPFAAALTSPAVVIMHAATQDLEVLYRASGVLPERLFDTQLAAAFVSHTLPSLASLVERYFSVHLPKGDRLTDWLRRPLGDDQRTYAAADVEFLLELRDILEGELANTGRADWAQQESELLRLRGAVSKDPLEAWQRIKEARSLKGEAAATAQAVAAWRETRAMDLDQPVRFVLSDLAVVGIAQRRPTSSTELARIRGVDERHSRGKVGESLLAVVAESRGKEPPKQHHPTFEIDRKLRPAVSLVAAWVSQLARELSIETSLVGTRHDIESLLSGDPESRLAKGWRADLVGEPIQSLVGGEAALAFDGKGALVLEPRSRSAK